MRKRGLALLVIVAAAGCGGDDDEPALPGDTLTVYSSLPAHGVSVPAARAVAAGQRLALREARSRAGGRRIRLVQLSSTEPGAHAWDPDQVSANAKRAADDPTAIAYLGELDYGASAVSLPITNAEEILQVSPGDGLTSLTQTPPGRPRAGPERYYPSERRTFVRLGPTDLGEADLLLAGARAAGSVRTAIVYDETIYGRELAGMVGSRLSRARAEVAESEELPSEPDDARGVAAKVIESRSDAVILAAVAGPATAPFLTELGRLAPAVPVFATSGTLVRRAPIPRPPRTMEAVSPVPRVADLPPAGRRILRRVVRADGASAGRAEAVAGYESMRLVLRAIRAAGPSRTRVVREALAIARRAPLGPPAFGLYRLRGGYFVFQRELL